MSTYENWAGRVIAKADAKVASAVTDLIAARDAHERETRCFTDKLESFAARSRRPPESYVAYANWNCEQMCKKKNQAAARLKRAIARRDRLTLIVPRLPYILLSIVAIAILEGLVMLVLPNN